MCVRRIDSATGVSESCCSCPARLLIVTRHTPRLGRLSLKLWGRRRRRFLNRLLSLPCARQNLLFNYFAATLAAEIRAAKAEGRYFEGMSELAGVPKLKQVRVASLCVPRCSVTTLRQWPLDA